MWFKKTKPPRFLGDNFFIVLGVLGCVSFGIFLKLIFSGSFFQVPPAGVIRQGVPFLMQAPLGEWDDPRQEDGCEEASVLMAMAWATGETLSDQAGRDAIIALSEFEKKRYGFYRDTSTFDTAQIFQDYFHYPYYSVRFNISADDIISALKEGKIVIVPLNGQKLNNPYFTSPGLLEHMLVVTGYDFSTKEFITNEPGTKNGQAYRYPYTILDGALRDYLTGLHENMNSIRKAMIVVERK